jgi:hypothetical protein
MSWNDPNGQGGGSDRHISAYCNMPIPTRLR